MECEAIEALLRGRRGDSEVSRCERVGEEKRRKRLRGDPGGRVRDPSIGPSRCAEEGGDRELAETHRGAFPSGQRGERTLLTQRGIAAQALRGVVEMQPRAC
ncbi:hypothetical protein NDU88_000523 [Pleurodeles waltl]|uniref:Uncharacterized protein n=1 Tax=Pleurodeles waltl TaxID=8319 RepID=A0AAV7THH9_PLEWA|nr:hypothetical protein NDU88_000523 [Pleurodeles waltl]